MSRQQKTYLKKFDPGLNHGFDNGYLAGDKWINILSNNAFILINDIQYKAVWLSLTKVYESSTQYTIIAPETLDEYKAAKILEINKKTDELISAGYTYASKQFSLSQDAQLNLIGLDNVKDELTYPILYNTIDDLDVYSVPDSATIHAMYLAALAVKRGHYDSGTALKDLVRAATTIEEVEAIIDNR